jgi:predicted enzyme related to lactoylglutathione lyase
VAGKAHRVARSRRRADGIASIQVDDLDAMVKQLTAGGAVFRSPIVNGVGGRQIIIDDPSGNPIELFEPTRAEARL